MLKRFFVERKMIVFIFFLCASFVLFIGLNRVNAETQTCATDNTSYTIMNSLVGKKIGNFTRGGNTPVAYINLGGTGGSGFTNITEMFIDKNIGLCVTPSISAPADNTTYYNAGVYTNAYISKAYAYAKRTGKYAEAQAAIWGTLAGDKSKTGDIIAVLYSKNKAKYTYSNGEVDQEEIFKDARNIASAINNESSSTTLYLWKPACGTGQQFVSEYAGKDYVLGEKISCGTGCNSDTTTDTPDVCETVRKVTVNVAEECGITTTYTDTNNWDCIKGNSQYLDNSIYDGSGVTASIGTANNYCTYFCREDNQTTYPGSNYVFYAGQYFTIGMSEESNTWGPITVYGRRECKSYYLSGGTYVQGINYQKYLTDIKNDIQEIKNAVLDLHLQQAKKESAASATVSQRDCNTENDYTDPVDMICTYTGYDEWGNGYGEVCSCPAGKKEHNGACYTYQVTNENYYEYASKDYTQWNGSYGGTYTEGSTCENQASNSVNTARYDAAIENMRQDIKTMEACDNGKTRYVLLPTITFEYSGQVYNYTCSDGDKELTSDLSADDQKEWTNAPTSNGGSDSQDWIVGCDTSRTGTTCTWATSNILYAKNASVMETLNERYISYSLDDSGYKYTQKTDGKTTNTLSGTISSNGTYQNFKSSVLPLSYNLKGGIYPIGIKYTNFGNKYDGTAYFDEQIKAGNANVSNGDTSANYEYTCTIAIENEILGDCSNYCHGDASCIAKCEGSSTCPSTCSGSNCASGITVIYRTIQLQKTSGSGLSDQETSFPSYNANGRSPGSNWSSDDISKYITYNRGVYGNEVYNKVPLYTITLTPSYILSIREYNDKEESYGGYADFDRSMKCDAGTGRNCLSSFIHQTYYPLFDKANSKCLDINNTTFDSCRYN